MLDRETDRAKRRAIQAQRPALRELSPATINKTLMRLTQILDVAQEYGLVDRNAAKGKRRRVKASKSAPVWLDRAEHIEHLRRQGGSGDIGDLPGVTNPHPEGRSTDAAPITTAEMGAHS